MFHFYSSSKFCEAKTVDVPACLALLGPEVRLPPAMSAGPSQQPSPHLLSDRAGEFL